MPLALAAKDKSGAQLKADLLVVGSTSTIRDLNDGRCGAALVGREPTSDELAGLEDHVVAYDAVVILLDQNSSVGGEWRVGEQPTHKTAGLHNLSSADLKGLFSFWLFAPEKRWAWQGEYYS
jgi:hypothetical protein